MKNINYTHHDDVIHVYDSNTGKYEEVRMVSSRIDEHKKVKLVSTIPSLVAHIAFQVSTA